MGSPTETPSPSDEGDAAAGGVELQHIELLQLLQRRLELRRGETFGHAALQRLRRPHTAGSRTALLPQRRKDGVRSAGGAAGGNGLKGGGGGEGDKRGGRGRKGG